MTTPRQPTHDPAPHDPATPPAAGGGTAVATRVTAPGRRPSGRAWRPGPVAAMMCFVALAAAANALAYQHPLVPVGFGLSATPVAFAVTVIDTPAWWLHRHGGQRLVFAAILAATAVSCAVAGPFGLAWGIAYAAAELVGLCTWRRLDDLRAHRVVVTAGALLELLVQAGVYVWLLRHHPPAARDCGPGSGSGVQPAWPAGLRRSRRIVATALSVAVFAICVVAANWLTSRYGFIPVGLGLSATAGTYAAGLCLLARDWVHDAAGRVAVLAAIGVGGVASAVMAGPRLALASAIAFVASELADLLVYQPL